MDARGFVLAALCAAVLECAAGRASAGDTVDAEGLRFSPPAGLVRSPSEVEVEFGEILASSMEMDPALAPSGDVHVWHYAAEGSTGDPPWVLLWRATLPRRFRYFDDEHSISEFRAGLEDAHRQQGAENLGFETRTLPSGLFVAIATHAETLRGGQKAVTRTLVLPRGSILFQALFVTAADAATKHGQAAWDTFLASLASDLPAPPPPPRGATAAPPRAPPRAPSRVPDVPAESRAEDSPARNAGKVIGILAALIGVIWAVIALSARRRNRSHGRFGARRGAGRRPRRESRS